jgi:hypothetical protein
MRRPRHFLAFSENLNFNHVDEKLFKNCGNFDFDFWYVTTLGLAKRDLWSLGAESWFVE